MTRLVATIAAVLCLSACKSLPPLVEQVPVVIEKIVQVPPELSAPCDRPKRQANTVGELKRLRAADLAAIDECNGRMDKIRKLGAP